MVVSPDVGGVVRAEGSGQTETQIWPLLTKRRPEAGVSEVMNIIGEVEGRHCVMVDDIVDSGGTLCNAAKKALMDAGALSVDAYVTRFYLAGRCRGLRPHLCRLWSQLIRFRLRLVMRVARNIRQISIAPLLGEAILRITEEKSVSSLFQ